MRIITIILSCTMLFSSCAYTIIGETVNKCTTPDCLRSRLGPPDEIIDNGDAGKIWLYSETWVKSTPGMVVYNDNYATYSNPSSYEYEKYVKFWIKDNYIQRWQTQGHKIRKLTTLGTIAVILAPSLIILPIIASQE